jgi:signal transduction histidine kinase
VHGPLTTEQREILEHLDREAETGEVEASKAEFLARLEEPEFIPTLQAVPASELVHAAARTLGTVARAAGIDLRLEVPDAGVGALADAGELPRALRAIGENALRFSPEGGQVSIRAVPEADGVRFEVEDHGIGIDPADHARIFEPFVRLESPVTRQRLGCGLGLAFAARIVRSHGAEIAVRSALGEGACFSFVLPYAALLSTQSISMEISLGGGGAPTEPL